MTHSKPLFLLCLAGVAMGDPLCLRGIGLADVGFEDEAVSSGGFLKPAASAWVFSNDAGVVEPFAPNTSTGPLSTWSATYSPFEGQQYASTYGGADTIRQALAFGSAGTYSLSVYAAAPSGTVTIPTVGTFPLVDGEFTLTLNNVAVGSLHSVPLGSSWTLYDAVFTVASPGTYDVGIRNTKTGAYFINYDSFAIEAVPEPSSVRLLMAVGIATAGGLLRRRLFQHWAGAKAS